LKTTEPKTPCRTPAEGRDGVTNIPTWKFDLLRRHILDVVGEAGAEGYAFADLSGAIAPRLSEDEASRLGKLGWHVTTVKLELEVAGELARMPKVAPQRLVLPAVR